MLWGMYWFVFTRLHQVSYPTIGRVVVRQEVYRTIAYIPDWSLIAAFGLPPAIWSGALLLRLRRRHRWMREGRCRACGYLLVGISGRCPECGLPQAVSSISNPATRL